MFIFRKAITARSGATRKPPTRVLGVSRQRATAKRRAINGHSTRLARVDSAKYPMLAVADKFRPRLAQAFLDMMQAAVDSVPVKELEGLIEQSNLAGVEQLLDVENRLDAVAKGRGLSAGMKTFYETLAEIFWAGAKAEMVAQKDTIVEKAASRKPRLGTELSLDLLNPEALAWVQTYTFNLIRLISKDVRASIKDIVVRAFAEGGHPYEQARKIVLIPGFGLTPTQAAAVANFRTALESGNPAQMREILERALRDGRFDSTVARAVHNKATLPQAKIDRMVGRYTSRYLKYRAETIARTETIRASNAGQQELWRQAVGQGLLKPERTRRIWIVTPDDRLCERCSAIPGLNPDGVPLDQPFVTEDGWVDFPVLHPNCRCTTGLIFLKRGEA